jgi:hypothetical protein
MSFSMAPLLMHSPDVSAPVRKALQEGRLDAAAELLFEETELPCADVRELVGLPSGGC